MPIKFCSEAYFVRLEVLCLKSQIRDPSLKSIWKNSCPSAGFEPANLRSRGESVVFIGEESSKRRVNAYLPKYISMAYYIMLLWIPGRDGTRSKVTGNFLVNALLLSIDLIEVIKSKNPSTSVGFEPVNLGSRSVHVTPRPPRPTKAFLVAAHGSMESAQVDVRPAVNCQALTFSGYFLYLKAWTETKRI